MARKKNRMANLEQVRLTDIGNKGKAVGRYGEKVVFVSGGVPGDVVEVHPASADEDAVITTTSTPGFSFSNAVSMSAKAPDKDDAAITFRVTVSSSPQAPTRSKPNVIATRRPAPLGTVFMGTG